MAATVAASSAAVAESASAASKGSSNVGTDPSSSSFASLEADKRRKITLKCLELEEMLESQG